MTNITLTKQHILDRLAITRKFDIDNIPSSFLNDEDVMLKAISLSYHYANFCGPELFNNKEFFMKACEIKNSIIQYFPHFNDDDEIASKLLKIDGNLLTHFSDRIQNEEKFVSLSIEQSFFTYDIIPEKFRNDKQFILKHLQCHRLYLSFKEFPEHLKADPDIIIPALQLYGININHLLPKDKNNKEYAYVAIKGQPESFKFVSDTLKKDKEIVNFAISQKKSGYLITSAAKSLLEDKELVINAFKNGKSSNILNLKLVKNNESIMKALIAIDLRCLKKINSNIINDTEYLKQLFIERIDDLEKLSKVNKISVLYRIFKNSFFLDTYMSIYNTYNYDLLKRKINANDPIVTNIYNQLVKTQLLNEITTSTTVRKKSIKF